MSEDVCLGMPDVPGLMSISGSVSGCEPIRP